MKFRKIGLYFEVTGILENQDELTLNVNFAARDINPFYLTKIFNVEVSPKSKTSLETK